MLTGICGIRELSTGREDLNLNLNLNSKLSISVHKQARPIAGLDDTPL